MSNSPEDFEKLRKLLQLKRHEQPPPGYFDRLPGQVMSRIKAEAAAGKIDLLSSNAPWAKRLIRMLETSPLFAGAFGATACALLIFGVTTFQYADSTAVASVSDNGATASIALASSATPETTAASSINPKFSVEIPGAGTLGSLTISGQPAGIEPVMYSPGH